MLHDERIASICASDLMLSKSQVSGVELTSMGSNKNSSKVDPRDFFSEYGEARYGIKVILAAVACASPSSIGTTHVRTPVRRWPKIILRTADDIEKDVKEVILARPTGSGHQRKEASTPRIIHPRVDLRILNYDDD